jgi:hypothetical protein
VYGEDARRTFYYYAESVDGSFSIPPRSYTENRFVTPLAPHNQCTSGGSHIFRSDAPELPHYRFQTLDTNTRIYLNY